MQMLNSLSNFSMQNRISENHKAFNNGHCDETSIHALTNIDIRELEVLKRNKRFKATFPAAHVETK